MVPHVRDGVTMSKISVKAAQGLSIRVNGQRVTDSVYVMVKPDHNVLQKIQDGSLVIERPSIKIEKTKKSEVLK